jgi:hypothetical protein
VNSAAENHQPAVRLRREEQVLLRFGQILGVEWKQVADSAKTGHGSLGLAGRCGAGLPRINGDSFQRGARDHRL